MSSNHPSALIGGIDKLLDIFVALPPLNAGDTVELELEAVNLIQKQLRLIRHLAFLNERELGAMLLQKAERDGRKMVDELAQAQMHPMIDISDEKIIRPVFGGRKRQGGEHE